MIMMKLSDNLKKVKSVKLKLDNLMQLVNILTI